MKNGPDSVISPRKKRRRMRFLLFSSVIKWRSVPLYFILNALLTSYSLFPGVSSKMLIVFGEPIDFSSKLEFCKSKPIISSLKMPSAVTLSGSIGKGMLCPFPALKAGLSPSCSPRWVPHCSQHIRSEMTGSAPNSGNSGHCFRLTIRVGSEFAMQHCCPGIFAACFHTVP
jgi:hypothetical protein